MLERARLPTASECSVEGKRIADKGKHATQAPMWKAESRKDGEAMSEAMPKSASSASEEPRESQELQASPELLTGQELQPSPQPPAGQEPQPSSSPHPTPKPAHRPRPDRHMRRTGANKPGWYVVQVRTGQEDRMCEVITRACEDHDDEARDATELVNLTECFNPRFKGQKKRKGQFNDVEYPLIPGYVIADVQNPAMLAQALRSVREFCRMLAAEETYAPLDERERVWVESQTKSTDHVIPLSFGYKEGDTLVVTDGPLAGNEAMISKLDRRNSMAHIELHVGPMTIRATLGLVIMPSGKVRQNSL